MLDPSAYAGPQHSTSDALTSQSVPDAVLVVPASLFQVAAGAVFGLWLGCLIAWVGCTLGMVVTFIMGRCCAARKA